MLEFRDIKKVFPVEINPDEKYVVILGKNGEKDFYQGEHILNCLKWIEENPTLDFDTITEVLLPYNIYEGNTRNNIMDVLSDAITLIDAQGVTCGFKDNLRVKIAKTMQQINAIPVNESGIDHLKIIEWAKNNYPNSGDDIELKVIGAKWMRDQIENKSLISNDTDVDEKLETMWRDIRPEFHLIGNQGKCVIPDEQKLVAFYRIKQLVSEAEKKDKVVVQLNRQLEKDAIHEIISRHLENWRGMPHLSVVSFAETGKISGSLLLAMESMIKELTEINLLEFNSQYIIGDSKKRFQDLIDKNWDWRSFYNGWIEGRSDMFADIKGLKR